MKALSGFCSGLMLGLMIPEIEQLTHRYQAFSWNDIYFLGFVMALSLLLTFSPDK